MDKLDLILEKLGTLEVGVEKLEAGQERLELGQVKLWEGQEELRVGQEKLWDGQEKLRVGQEKLWASHSSLDECGLRETNQIVRDIRDRQDVTNAKLDAVTRDVHYLVGKSVETDKKLEAITVQLVEFRSETRSKFRRIEGHGLMVDRELELLNARVDKLEAK